MDQIANLTNKLQRDKLDDFTKIQVDYSSMNYYFVLRDVWMINPETVLLNVILQNLEVILPETFTHIERIIIDPVTQTYFEIPVKQIEVKIDDRERYELKDALLWLTKVYTNFCIEKLVSKEKPKVNNLIQYPISQSILDYLGTESRNRVIEEKELADWKKYEDFEAYCGLLQRQIATQKTQKTMNAYKKLKKRR
jgi:hypothetical protein